MFKQMFFLFSLIHLMQCFSIRNNLWRNRRNENSQQNCDIEFDNENPSIEAKICGYCFAKCQQQFAACLLTQMNEVSHSSFNQCQEQSIECEKRCFNDKRTSRIAEANWAQVVKVLQKFNFYPSTNNEEKNDP